MWLLVVEVRVAVGWGVFENVLGKLIVGEMGVSIVLEIRKYEFFIYRIF